MTLATWLAEHPEVSYVDPGAAGITTAHGAIWLASRDPALWQLDDYVVSSVVSGPAVYLVPRPRRTPRQLDAQRERDWHRSGGRGPLPPGKGMLR